MASKLGIATATVGATAAPVTGYFVYRHLTGAAQPIQLPPGTATIPSTTLSLKRNDGKAFEIQDSCIKDKFSQLEIKGGMNNTETKADSEKTTLGDHNSGTLDGCLIADLKWRNKTDKQHAISGNIEMTLTKGSHGLIFRTLMTNLLDEGKDGAFQYMNQAFKLTKDSNNKWTIDHGYIWTDELSQILSTTDNREKANLIFKGLINVVISYWDLCSRGKVPAGNTGQECAGINEKTYEASTMKKQKWETNTSGKGIFEHLEIKGGKAGSEKSGNLWGNSGQDVFNGKVDSGLLYLYEKDKGFYKIDHSTNRLKENLTKWFEPLKGEKGDWKDR